MFLHHGAADPMIPLAPAKQSYEYFRLNGFQVKFEQEEGLGHSLSQLEITKISAFFQSLMTVNTLANLIEEEMLGKGKDPNFNARVFMNGLSMIDKRELHRHLKARYEKQTLELLQHQKNAK